MEVFSDSVAPVSPVDDGVSALPPAEYLPFSAGKYSVSPGIMRLGRDSFYDVWDQGAREALRMLHPLLTVTTATADSAEGIAAFTEKRAPNWTGR